MRAHVRRRVARAARRRTQRAPRRTLAELLSEAGVLGAESSEERAVRRRAAGLRESLSCRQPGGRASADGKRKRANVDGARADQGFAWLPRHALGSAFLPLGTFSRRGVEGDAGGFVAPTAWFARARS